MSGLRTLLQASRSPDTAVAIRRCAERGSGARVETRTWAQFQSDVARLGAELARGERGGWLLYCDDAYAFAVALLALWHTGRHALLPPNRQPDTLRSLAQGAVGVVTDCEGGVGALHPLVSPQGAEALALGSANSIQELAPDALAVELFTSGTTGAAKPVVKRICHLDDEIAVLARHWDPQLASATMFSTVSPEHLYGLLFGVLWPLCAGRSFHSQHFLHIGEMIPPMLAAGRCALASAPTTLRRLARHASGTQLRDRCALLFSSGGPLAIETARDVARHIGAAPVEVLGSTETGGIAWRQQAVEGPATDWTPLAAVQIRRDAHTGELRVRSPFVSVESGPEGYATGDRITLGPEGRFSMAGRADQVVKVGEKRLDLDEMAALLRGHPSVDDAALLTLEREGEARVAAVVVPSERKDDATECDDGAQFRQRLRDHLRARFDPVLHPRYWRLVPELPTTSRGKVSRAALAAFFRDAAENGAVADRPEVLGEEAGRDVVERSCRVPVDLVCLAGHFPDGPVVPGVLQLDWAMELAAQILGEAPRFAEIESLKLISPLTPGQPFRIRSRVLASSVEFRLWHGEVTYATGRVRLEPTESIEERARRAGGSDSPP